jgi:hypothetical protein
MRIELQDCNGHGYQCTSSDPATIGRWFAEHAELLMSADARVMPYPLYIWPQDAREQEILSGPARLQAIQARMTQDGLLELAQVILDAAARLGELEKTR